MAARGGGNVPIFAVVVAAALLSGSWRAVPLIGQGVVAGLLLFFYLGYQHYFIRDPNVPQSFNLALDAGLVEPFLRQLLENGRAIIGLSHRDAELGITLDGLGVFGSPIFWGVMAVLTAFGIGAIYFMPRSPVADNRRLAWATDVGWFRMTKRNCFCWNSRGAYIRCETLRWKGRP